MKIREIVSEGFVNGLWDGDPAAFRARLIHETTTEAAESIRVNGFRPNPEGIFFNLEGDNYSGGAYGGAKVICVISGPKEGLLDMSDEDNLTDEEQNLDDGFAIAAYAKQHDYWAWKDDIQLAVLDKRHVLVVHIEQ